MPDHAPATPARPSTASGVMAQGPGETVVVDPVWDERTQRLHLLMADNMPAELRKLAGDLMDSLRHNAGVAERFDAFCGQAFSKPQWAVPASAFISELFEDHEDRLAELARVPDLVIELGCGQAALTCTVASKWATRGETHRLSRLAESIVTAHGTMKNPAAVEVMLALAATLAVTRPSRAEPLFNAALPAASAEHAEALTDAKLWLAAGKVLASAQQDVRELWDARMRRPRATWKWESELELRALRFLASQVTPDMEAAQLFSNVAPPSWWELAMQRVEDQQVWQRKLVSIKRKNPGPSPGEAPEEQPQPAQPKPRPHSHAFGDPDVLAVRPHASSVARFVLGWAIGVFIMGGTFLLFPEKTYRAIMDFRGMFGAAPAPVSESPAAGKAWREAQVASFTKGKESLEPLIRRVKGGTWAQNLMLLSGHAPELPSNDPRYLQMLVWLHLDPPSDPETRQHLPRLLVEKADTSAMAVWEGLLYPGSPNAEEIRATARELCKEKASSWTADDLARLHAISEAPAADAGKP
jgi:hypothetical protein